MKLAMLGKLLVAAAELLGTLWERLRRPRSAMDAEAPVRLQTLIDRARVRIGAKRLLLLVTHNGGTPLAGAWGLRFVTILRASCATRGMAGRLLADWMARAPDEVYLRFLARVSRQRFVFLVTAEMADGELRDEYEAHGIVCACVIPVRSSPRKMHYLSAVYDHMVDEWKAREDLEAIAARVRVVNSLAVRLGEAFQR